MKRSYQAGGTGQASPYGAATYSAQPQLNQAPPLPAGQPPPPPVAGQYPHYPSYPTATPGTGQQVAQHPQYPGYGYGGQAPQPQAAPAAPAPVQQDAATAAYAAQYAAYYAAYAQAAQAQVAQAPAPPAFAAGPPPPPTAPYPVAGPPQPYPQAQHQLAHQASPLNSSQGAPPYKRTRYDQPPMPQATQPPLPPGPPPPMPPSVLPPVGGRGPPRSAADRTSNFNSRGPPPRDTRDYDYAGDYRYSNGPGGGRGASPGPPRGSGGGGRGPRMGGNGPSGPSMGPPLPSGPRGPRAGPSSLGGRDDRGGGGGSASRGNSSRAGPTSLSSSRPLSGLPGSHKYNGPVRGAASASAPSIPNAPKGPKSLANSVTSSTASPRRGERKWGTSAPGDSRRTSERDKDRDRDRDRDGEGGKRTLTDFRIEGLEIDELDWKWNKLEEKEDAKKENQVEKVKGEEGEGDEKDQDTAVETGKEDQKQVKDEDASTAAKVEDDAPAAENGVSEQQEEDSNEANDSVADMSIDGGVLGASEETSAENQIATASTGSAESLAQTSTVAKGKHARPEDDSATEDSTNEEEKVRKERETKAKKVKVDQQAEDDEKVSFDTTEMGNEGEKGAAKAQPPSEEHTTGQTAESTGAEAPKPAIPQLTHPLPSKPVTIPTGPKSAHPPRPTSAKAQSLPPTPAPPSSRENSRLRIYFSSPIPISSSAASATTASIPRDRALTPKVEDGGRGEPAPTPSNAPKKEKLDKPANPSKLAEKIEGTKQEAEEDTALDGEDVDGEDLDGEAVDGEAVDGEVLDGQDVGGAETSNIDGAQVKPSPEDVEAMAAAEPVESADPPTNEAEGKATRSGENSTEANREPSPAPPPPAAELVVPPPEPTADRISISYARNTRRMVVDAEVVESIKIFRASGKIEVVVLCQAPIVGVGEHQLEDEYRICKGILVEALDPEADDYIVMDRASLEDAWRQHERPNEDSAAPLDVEEPLLPPLHHFLTHSSPNEASSLSIVPSTSFTRPSFTIVAHLDRANPLTEARWVKTGEVENWILSLGIANGQDPKDPEQLSKWLGKISVVDPDQPPTIQHALDSWATSSNAGSLEERKDFVKSHMSNIDNVVEILLRLSRGDRSGPSHYSSSSSAQPSTVGALAHQLAAPFPTQQTQVSLAVLAMFRLTVETAEKAGIDKSEIEKQVSEIVRNVPYHLQFKALDGMFREVYKTKGSKSGSGRPARGSHGHGKRD